MPMTLRFGWAETRSEIQAQSWRLVPCSSFFLHLSVLSTIPHCLGLEGYPISNFRHLLQSKSRQTSGSKEREGFKTVICDLFLGREHGLGSHGRNDCGDKRRKTRRILFSR